MNNLFWLLLVFICFKLNAGNINLNDPIMFVTQFPVANNFATTGSAFANHDTSMQSVGRGGDLYIRYLDGTLRNLIQEACYGMTGLQGVTVGITVVSGQPDNYNNIAPIYGSDDAIIFTSDMPRSKKCFNS